MPYIGCIAPNSYHIIMGSLYDYTDTNEEGLPRYSYFTGFTLRGILYTFGTAEYEFYYKTIDTTNVTG